jgi:hypothetical protein
VRELLDILALLEDVDVPAVLRGGGGELFRGGRIVAGPRVDDQEARD